MDTNSKNDIPLGVVLVNYCGFSDTLECVDSLKKSIEVNVNLLIVDNASPDGSGAKLKENYQCDPMVEVALSPQNNGFGFANNYGMRYFFSRGYKYVLLLNNDTIVDKSMAMNLLKKATEDIVTIPLMLYKDKPETIWYGGGKFDTFGIPRHEFNGESIKEVPLEDRNVDFATGCCMLIPKSVFEDTNGFDEKYFLYWEDADWSIRIRRAGFSIRLVPSAKLWHKVSASTGGNESSLSYYYGVRNRFYAIEKFNLGLLTKLWAYFGLLRGLLAKREKYKYARNAYADYRANIMGIMPKKNDN